MCWNELLDSGEMLQRLRKLAEKVQAKRGVEKKICRVQAVCSFKKSNVRKENILWHR